MAKKIVDIPSLMVWTGFILLSALALWVMYPSYQIQRHQRAVYRLLKAGQTAKAIPNLQALVDLQPSSAQWHMKLGQAYLDSEPMEPAKALEQFKAALTLDPSLDIALDLAICWSELGDTAKADQIFKAGLAPEDPEALASDPAINYYLGLRAFQAEEYQKAAHFFQAAAADPKWDARAEPWRQKIARHVLGAGAPAHS